MEIKHAWKYICDPRRLWYEARWLALRVPPPNYGDAPIPKPEPCVFLCRRCDIYIKYSGESFCYRPFLHAAGWVITDDGKYFCSAECAEQQRT